MLISTILNFQTARFERGNDLPYILFLPTYTATAWYHGQLSEDLQARELRDVLAEVDIWAETDYTLALGKGNRLEFRDFGVFEIRTRAAREAQNPKTLEKVHVPARRSVKFKMGRLMKQKLNTHE